jgi:PKD domain
MSSAPVAPRLAPLVLTVGLLLLAPGAARAQPAASFEFSPTSPLTGELVTFVSTASGATEPQRWDLDGDGVCDDSTGPSAGVYSVKLCVSDGMDDATATRKITVTNRPPIAAFTYAPASPLTGEVVTLTSTSLDPDGPIVSLAWDLDNDGAFDDGTGATASLAFRAPGAYAIRLLVVDRDGATGFTLQTIAVGKRPPELLASSLVVRLVGKITRRGTRIRQLVVVAPAGSKVSVRCRGRGCPVHQLTRTATSRARPQVQVSRVVRIRRFRHRLLRPGAAVRIWVTSPGRIGKYTRFRIRSGKPPKRVDRCVMPGTTRPSRCPSP